jgi:hypothetical protein
MAAEAIGGKDWANVAVEAYYRLAFNRLARENAGRIQRPPPNYTGSKKTR